MKVLSISKPMPTPVTFHANVVTGKVTAQKHCYLVAIAPLREIAYYGEAEPSDADLLGTSALAKKVLK